MLVYSFLLFNFILIINLQCYITPRCFRPLGVYTLIF
nr:MAG TPA: hypothetical protein [Caudoviricetes sp.]